MTADLDALPEEPMSYIFVDCALVWRIGVTGDWIKKYYYDALRALQR